MININKLRTINPQIITISSHPGIIQAILDFDYLAGKESPSIVGIIASGRNYERYFWGTEEVLIPLYSSTAELPESLLKKVNLFLNLTSGRRNFATSQDALANLPNLLGGTLFAENTPEKNSIQLYHDSQKLNKFIIGPSSVGLLIPNILKLGAIGGIQPNQLVDAKLFTPGDIACFSSSGGMTNEIINIIAKSGGGLSFALSFGGDRFPLFTPEEAFLTAEADKNTKTIVYFGELGGDDEYKVAELITKGKVTKPVIAYIAGSISEMFTTPPQFGHAKALAGKFSETAKAKREILRKASKQVRAANTFAEFVEQINNLKYNKSKEPVENSKKLADLKNRTTKLFSTTISGEKNGVVNILGQQQETLVESSTYSQMVVSMLLGKQTNSKLLIEFTDLVLKLLIDHGPYVSGAVNTMITARAGKDLVSGLVAGLLTIGPRFGGAINQAADNWLNAVSKNIKPNDLVEDFAKRREYISGIGHKKYSSDLPDPRVAALLKFKSKLKNPEYTNFALAVAKITTSKKSNLILNVDGTIAALLLDLLVQEESYGYKELKQLVDIEFFNAFFVISRAVGFTAHYLDQRKIDEGLFRLTPNDISVFKLIK